LTKTDSLQELKLSTINGATTMISIHMILVVKSLYHKVYYKHMHMYILCTKYKNKNMAHKFWKVILIR